MCISRPTLEPRSREFAPRRMMQRGATKITSEASVQNPSSASSRPTASPTPLQIVVRDHADRDTIASRLMPYRDENGQRWADLIDFLTM